MARRLILGRAGAGKTRACLDAMERALAHGRRALFLVPTYSQAEHLRVALLSRVRGLDPTAVATFTSFAESRAGRRLRTMASPAERDRAAAAALEEAFPEAAGHAGFRAEFLAAVKEIKETGADQAVEHARAHFPETSRGRRLFEAYARYRELLPRPDHEDMLLAARDSLRRDPERLEVLRVDGFHDFTGLEREILDLLAEHAADCAVTLPLDPEDAAAPVFSTAARTAAALRGWRKEPLSGNRRAQAAGLRALEERLFRRPGPEPAPAEGVELLACSSHADEADRLARWVARSGREPRDVLLIRRSFDGLHDTYRAAFARHGVPLRFFGPQPLGRTPAARAAALALRALAGEAKREELLPLLRSPFLLDPPSGDAVDRLQARLREHGEIDDWDAAEPRLRALEGARGNLRDAFDGLVGLRRAVELQPDGSEELAAAARLFALLRDEAAALCDLPLAEAARRLLERLPLLRAPAHDRRTDCVYAVDVLDARQWEKPVVLAAGLDTQSYPRQVRQDLFLRDDERRELASRRGLALPLRASREDEERYLFYVTLTRARERLVLSYVRFDEEGTPRSPSPYLEEALDHLSAVPVREVALSELYPRPEEAVSRRDLHPIVADALARLAAGRERPRDAALAAALYDAGAVSREALGRSRRLELARRRPIPSVELDSLSPSAVNDYLRCPYLFLARKVLRVRAPRERELDALLRGEILHAVLERFVNEGRPADAGAVFDAVWEEKAAGIRLGLDGVAERRAMRIAARRAAERLRDAPVEEVERKLDFELDGVRVVGRVDRIDDHPEGKIVRDYKSRAPKLRDVESGRNLQLDLYLLGLDRVAGAVFEGMLEEDTVGFVLEELRDAAPGKNVLAFTRAQLDERLARARAEVARIAAAVREGRLALDPHDPDHCTRGRCDAYDLCRVSRGRELARAARREGS